MILILEYDGETEASKKGILKDANNMQSRHNLKYGGNEKLCKSMEEFKTYMEKPDSKTETKIHVVCHGNRTCVGNFNGGRLAEQLWNNGLNKRNSIKQITFHSCESGVEELNPENRSWTPSMAWQAAAYFAAKGRGIVVKGAEGTTITDSVGQSHVLKPGEVWDAKHNITRELEQTLLQQKCAPKGTLRPKYASYNGTAPYKM